MPPHSRPLTPAEHSVAIAKLNDRLDAMNIRLLTGSNRLNAILPSRPDPELAAAISADLDAIGLDDITQSQIRT